MYSSSIGLRDASGGLGFGQNRQSFAHTHTPLFELRQYDVQNAVILGCEQQLPRTPKVHGGYVQLAGCMLLSRGSGLGEV